MCTVNLQGITLAKIFKTSSRRAIVSLKYFLKIYRIIGKPVFKKYINYILKVPMYLKHLSGSPFQNVLYNSSIEVRQFLLTEDII